MGPISIPLLILAGILVLVVGATLLLYIIVPLCKGIGFCFRQVFNFIVGEIADVFRLLGSIITGLLFVPMTILNIVVGRWSAATHFGRAIKAELSNILLCVYRMAIGHPARLFCLHGITDGLERRLPAVVAAAPGADVPGKKTGKFPGYVIVGSLAGGGSGGKLYVAEPDDTKLAAFARAGVRDIRQVVIKSFSIHDGSSLPQIVRESRALDAAKKLGLVLDHELTNERFFYVMRYMPGQSLGLVTQQLHTASADGGLGEPQLRTALSYSADLLRTLQSYHAGGLWHKDVKPDNIIVDSREAHLVDFGLITPLRSAMTLTTHGTEYFRDPEMVRLALRGVKVHEVDGAKFDIYAAGAVLYSLVENSFPAHGVLSPINKRCPEALRWIVRRAMTDYDKRYTSAGQMLADLDVVRFSRDPFAVKPIDLPSMRGLGVAVAEEADAAVHAATRDAGHFAPAAAYAAAGSPTVVIGPGVTLGPGAVIAAPVKAATPVIRLLNWWTGSYGVRPPAASPAAPGPTPDDLRASPIPHPARPYRRPAAEQLERARTRAAQIRRRAHERRNTRRRGKCDFSTAPNAGVIFASLLFLGCAIVGVASLSSRGTSSRQPHPAMPFDVSADDAMTTFHLRELAVAQPKSSGPSGKLNRSEDAPTLADTGFRIEDRRAPEARTAPAAPAPPDAFRGDVLIVSDFRAPVPAIVRRLADAARTALAHNQLRSIGDLVPVDAADQPGAPELDMIASLRASLGLTPLDAAEASAKLVAWLNANPDKAQAIVWFSPSPDDPSGRPVIRLVGPLSSGEFDPEEIARIREELSGTLQAFE